MLIQVNYGDIARSDTLEASVHQQIQDALGHLADRLTRVEVHLRDDSSPSKKTPNDRRCTMEARPAGMQPVVVEHSGDDFYVVIGQASDKLARVVQKTFDRKADR